MAARNRAESKRFVLRSSDKKLQAYSVSASGSKSHVARKILQPQAIPKTEVLPSSPPPLPQTLVDTDTPRTEVTPARRVVVIRNTKHPQVHEGPIDLGNFGQADSIKIPPVINNGVSVLLMNLGSCFVDIREYFSILRFILFDDLLHHLNHQNRLSNVITNKVKYIFGFYLFYGIDQFANKINKLILQSISKLLKFIFTINIYK
jgi:hypothetical protein